MGNFNKRKLPPPSPTFGHDVTVFGQPDAKGIVNGDITADFTAYPVHLCKHAGRIVDVNFALVKSGADQTDAMSFELDVLINGTSCLDTKPKFTYQSGEQSVPISTWASGEGIIQAVIDYDNINFNPGDIITMTGDITRTIPDTEMNGLCTLVQFEPIIPK